jgi:hypothetical protein
MGAGSVTSERETDTSFVSELANIDVSRVRAAARSCRFPVDGHCERPRLIVVVGEPLENVAVCAVFDVSGSVPSFVQRRSNFDGDWYAEGIAESTGLAKLSVAFGAVLLAMPSIAPPAAW